MLLVLLSASACATSGPSNPDCNMKPVYLDPADILSEQTERTIIGNNEIGEKNCGWKPPR